MGLKLHNLTYAQKGRNLISSISLAFIPGKIYGILGPNGSGKTTLLKNIAGIWKPTSGSVEWLGVCLKDKSRKEIGRLLTLVPQILPLPFDYTAFDIVAMGRYAHGDMEHAHAIIEKALHQVDGWHLRHRPISELSGGERQRIFLARAIATEAPILLLDEPASHLDLRHQIGMWSLLKELAAQKRTIIASIHDLAGASRFCDEVAILKGGNCLGQGPFSAVVTDEVLEQVFGVKREYF